MLFRHNKQDVTVTIIPNVIPLLPGYSQPTAMPGHETTPQNDLRQASPKVQNVAISVMIPHHTRVLSSHRLVVDSPKGFLDKINKFLQECFMHSLMF